MERQGDEVHIETDEARGASTPNIVRWVLGISLFAAIALLSVIWISGAATHVEPERPGEGRDRALQDYGSQGGVLQGSEEADAAAPAPPAAENESQAETPAPSPAPTAT